MYCLMVKTLFHQYRDTGDKTGLKVIFSPAYLEFAGWEGGLEVVPPDAPSLILHIASCQVDSVFCLCQLLLQYYSIKQGKITSYIVSQADWLARIAWAGELFGVGGGGRSLGRTCSSYCHIFVALLLDGAGHKTGTSYVRRGA